MEGNKGEKKKWDNCNSIINKIYLKNIQWLHVGESRKSQKQLCGGGLQSWLAVDKNRNEET